MDIQPILYRFFTKILRGHKSGILDGFNPQTVLSKNHLASR